jgi:hypothetical protein
MPISTLPVTELRKLTPQQLADLALQADQESRRAMRRGDYCAAREWDVEAERLCGVLQHV